MDRRHLTRREMARAIAGAAVLTGASTLARGPQAPTTDVLIDVLAQFRSHVLATFGPSELEALAVAAHRTASRQGVTTLEQAAIKIVGRDSQTPAALSDAGQLRAIIERRIRADFEHDELVSVGGWLLSRTELLIVALALRKPV